tara:strand:- start:2040 stop:2936 length:897 start_codon:yes stop_codon:yes gene_type:complete
MISENKPLITILISSYNDPKLELALESLKNQTYKNFNIILINDGGVGLEELINKFKVLKIEYLNLKKNLGLSKCLNIGIKKVNTKFIARMDADDYCLPERLEMQLDYIRKHDLDLIGSAVISNSKSQKNLYKIKHNLEGKDISKLLFKYVPIAHPTFFAKSEVFKNILYDEKIRYSQDYDFLARCAINQYKMGNLNIPLLIYNNDPSQNLEKIFFQIKISNEISKKYKLYKNKKIKYKLNYKNIYKKISYYELKSLLIRNTILMIKNIYLRKIGLIFYFLISFYSKELRDFNFRSIKK